MTRSAGIDRVIERVIARLVEIEQVYGAGVREQQSLIVLAELRQAGDAVEAAFRKAYVQRFGG